MSVADKVAAIEAASRVLGDEDPAVSAVLDTLHASARRAAREEPETVEVLKKRIEQLEIESSEMRDLTIQLSRKIDRQRGEKDTLEEQCNGWRSKCLEKDLLLQDCIKSVTSSAAHLKKMTVSLRSAIHPSERDANLALSRSSSPSGSMHSAPGSPDVEITKFRLENLTSECHTLHGIVTEAASLLWGSDRPESEPARQLNAQIAVLRSKLEKQSEIEQDNTRLRRVLNTHRRSNSAGRGPSTPLKRESDSEIEQVTPPAEEPTSPTRPVLASPPAVIKMPGCTEHLLRPCWAVRSVGVQCMLVSQSPGQDVFPSPYLPRNGSPGSRTHIPRSSESPFSASRKISTACTTGSLTPRSLSKVRTSSPTSAFAVRQASSPLRRLARPPKLAVNSPTTPRSSSRQGTPSRRSDKNVQS